MAYELIEGSRPFPGPATADYRRQHVEDPPPATRRVPPTLSSLITECMYKPQAARPTAANVLRRLEASQQAASSAEPSCKDVMRAVWRNGADEAIPVCREITRRARTRLQKFYFSRM